MPQLDVSQQGDVKACCDMQPCQASGESATGRGMPKALWTVNINDSGILAWDKNLMEVACEILNCRPERLHTMPDVAFERLTKQLHGIKVETYHSSKQGDHRTHKIHSVHVDKTSLKHNFECDGRSMSIAEYFEQKWQKRIEFPDAPLVQVYPPRKGTFFPLEICHLVREKVTKQIDESVKAAIGNILTVPPKERHEHIQSVRNNTFLDNELLRDYKLDLDEEMLKVSARVLDPPTLKYHSCDEAQTDENEQKFDSEGGTWNAARKMFCVPKNIRQWAVVSFCDTTLTQADKFVEGLVNSAKGLNIWLHEKPYLTRFAGDPMESLPELVSKVMESCCNTCQICVCILPPRQKSLYQQIKQAFEMRCPTQCVVGEKTPILDGRHRGVQSHIRNILSKMNQKVMGTNQCLQEESRSKNILKRMMGKDKSCIVLGGDVTSLGIGTKRELYLCALVGSLDDECTVFGHCCRAQTRGSDTMTAFEEMFDGVMKQRTAKRSQWPRRIIYFRDGLNETQMETITSQELTGIGKAYDRAGQPAPLIVCIGVQKRHQTRFFAGDPKDRHANLPAGTVLMDNLTHPSKHFNFYLLSNAGVEGTAKPCRYFVLRNDMSDDVDNLDFGDLVFEMCHLYGRCQKSVSLPSPVYYAHLLADRMKLLTGRHVNEQTGFNWLSDSDSSPVASPGPAALRGKPDAGASTAQDFDTKVVEVANTYLREMCDNTNPMFYC